MSHRFDNNVTDDALAHDPIAAMEQVVGKRWTEWDEAEQLASLGMAMRSNEAKTRILHSRDDNAFGDKLPRFERIVSDIGFKLVLTVDFKERREGRQEAMKVWWLEQDGILLEYDTYYSQETVNSGNFGYNWRPSPGLEWSDRCRCTSSSSPADDGILAGSHDCREAMRRNIERLREHGEFIVPWRSADCPYISLTHYGDFDQLMPMRERINLMRKIGY